MAKAFPLPAGEGIQGGGANLAIAYCLLPNAWE
jgi:hypothetical protein